MADCKVLCGDARSLALPDRSVHTIALSVPYWGLRNYGTDPVVWGGDPNCDHVWVSHRQYNDSPTRQGGEGVGFDNADTTRGQRWTKSNFCKKCNAWRGSLGLEPKLEQWLDNLVQCAREWRRTLRDDGTLWVNCGDSYARQGGDATAISRHWDGRPKTPKAMGANLQASDIGLKPKDLIGLPWRLAFALQADGWYLRHAIVWAKGVDWMGPEREAQEDIRHALEEVREFAEASFFGLSRDLSAALKKAEKAVDRLLMAGAVMPESVHDRCTQSYEMVFMFSKKDRYYYDSYAIRSPNSLTTGRWGNYTGTKTTVAQAEIGGPMGRTSGIHNQQSKEEFTEKYYKSGRNARTVWMWPTWRVGTSPKGTFVLPDGEEIPHFAAWPQRLVERMIRAGTSEKVCATCGAPFERVVKSISIARQGGIETHTRPALTMRHERGEHSGGLESSGLGAKIGSKTQFVAWHPACTCHGSPVGAEVPCRACNGTGQHHTSVETRDEHMPEGGRRESHKRGVVPNMGSDSMEYTDDPCPRCRCPDCEGTGLKMTYQRGKQGWTSGTALQGQPQRDNSGGMSGIPKQVTDEPCPTCKGRGALGYVQGPTWPEEVLKMWPVVPATVLDPMVGSGTTLRAALSLGRNAIGNDLNPQYVKLATARCLAFPDDVPTKSNRKAVEVEKEELPLFSEKGEPDV